MFRRRDVECVKGKCVCEGKVFRRRRDVKCEKGKCLEGGGT